ncbi:MAG: TlpA family protein disulfide reductase [Saprospiraceae bacterium]|nr:TlpA family protein disulfide reductase [Saprospiraceae bacterium]
MKLLGWALFITIFATSFVADDRIFPDATLKTLDGKSVSIKDELAKNKLTYVSFWATWCAPCKRELDAMAELFPGWREKYNLNVIAISVDDARGFAKVPSLVKSKGWEYVILSDMNNTLQQSLNFQSIPQTFLVDAQGNILYSHTGYSPGDEFELEELFKKHTVE